MHTIPIGIVSRAHSWVGHVSVTRDGQRRCITRSVAVIVDWT